MWRLAWLQREVFPISVPTGSKTERQQQEVDVEGYWWAHIESSCSLGAVLLPSPRNPLWALPLCTQATGCLQEKRHTLKKKIKNTTERSGDFYFLFFFLEHKCQGQDK